MKQTYPHETKSCAITFIVHEMRIMVDFVMNHCNDFRVDWERRIITWVGL